MKVVPYIHINTIALFNVFRIHSLLQVKQTMAQSSSQCVSVVFIATLISIGEFS
jgi:hypothetical protein